MKNCQLSMNNVVVRSHCSVLCVFSLFICFACVPLEGDIETVREKAGLNSCTVTFNTNCDSVVRARTVKKGGKVAEPQGVVRNGYALAGWYTEPALINVWDFAADTVTRNITLYAKWNAVYTVTYDKNADDAEGTTPDSEHTCDVEKKLSLNGYTRSGYVFVGWSRSGDGELEYEDEEAVINLSTVAGATVTLYAVWSDKAYTVVYNKNADDAAGTMANSVFLIDVPQNLRTNFFSRTGYTFAGWTRTSTGTLEFTDGQIIPPPNLTQTPGETVTLYAVWNPITYTVRYNADGGTGTMADQQFTYDVPQNLRKNTFTRTGYTFAGWTRTADGALEFPDEQALPPPNLSSEAGKVVSLYAKWNPIAYTVVYNKNADNTTGTMANSDRAYDDGKSLTLNTFIRTGYDFAGWARTSTGAVELVDGHSGNLTATAGTTVTLYAKWNPITYYVAYNVNGGTGTMNPNPSIHTYDIAKALTLNGFTRTGYTFAGWKDGQGTNYTDGESVENLTTVAGETVTLYAQWDTITYSVRYYNGSEYIDDPRVFTYDVPQYLRKNSFSPSSGYRFSGWATTISGESMYGDEDSAMNLTINQGERASLYARWAPSDSALVRFELNGGNPISPNPVVLSGPIESRKVSPPNPSPTRTGYTFGGWYTDTGLTVQYNFESIVYEDITLHARWYSTVTFNANGATSGTAPTAMTANAGSSITLPGAGNLARTGYTFGGWITSTGTDVSSPYMPDGHITLYARWYSTITFNSNNATNGAAPMAMTANAGSSITLPGAGNLARTGYTFGGWITSTGTDVSSPYTPTGDITLYARWYSTVTFNSNNATSGTAPAAMTANAGSSITLPGAGNLARTGYTFGGWNENASGTGTNYEAGSPYTPDGDITLYALWEPNSASITIDFEQITDSAPTFADITISRTGSNSYPVTFDVALDNAGQYTGIAWEVAGVGIYAGQTVTGSGAAFTLNAKEVKYNAIGTHSLILTVVKGGMYYQRAIPFIIVP